MQKVNMFNGNNHRYIRDIPKIHIITDLINDVALNHIKKQTGLNFIKTGWGYNAQPKTFYQITKLFLTYNFKTQYNDNSDIHNTLLLKFCNNEGFKVHTICFNCCKDNNIYTKGLNKNNKLLV